MTTFIKIFSQQREIDTVINDIIKHMCFNQEKDKYCPKLLSIISKILLHMHSFSALFAMVSSFF